MTSCLILSKSTDIILLSPSLHFHMVSAGDIPPLLGISAPAKDESKCKTKENVKMLV